jgi:curved DNA-binding protein CbpA
MPPRPALPDDDLYRRLGVPTNAGVEAIEIAWRALLRRHHPDVAGPDGLELAKRINVAHDWLSDPVQRARYDRERGLRHATGPRGDPHGGAWHARGPRGSAGPTAGSRGWADGQETPARGSARHREDPVAVVDRFVARVAALTPTELDRLALSEPPPIAFAATIRRFLPLDKVAALDDVDRRVEASLPPGADRPAIRDAIDGYATELVLGSFLDDLLTEPFRGRTHERLTRGWDAAVGQPRYGPNGAAVEALLGRIGGLDRVGVRALAATGVSIAGTDAPWPPGVSAEEDDALRISAQLATADAGAAVPAGTDAATRSRARRAVARPAHLLVLRHAFAPAAYAELTAPWRPWLIAPDGPPPIRRPPRRS